MKRIVSLLLSAVLVLSLSACGSSQTANQGNTADEDKTGVSQTEDNGAEIQALEQSSEKTEIDARDLMKIAVGMMY